MIRKPAVAGYFYERKKEKLLEQIKSCFLKGVGELPRVRKGKGKIKGIVVPHAGYEYSGYVAAHAYYEIAKEFPEKFIILGTYHYRPGLPFSKSPAAISTKGEWETPLGIAKIDEDAKEFCKGVIKDDEMVHKYEHSIEVQLPFLQFINQDFTFIPICLSLHTYEVAKEVGEIISKAEDAVIIASTDFSHEEFFKMPSKEDIKREVEDKDKMAIEKIIEIDAKGFIRIVDKEKITVCDPGGVAAMLEAVKKQGASKARLLKYATSYDVEPGTYCVGYAAIVIE